MRKIFLLSISFISLFTIDSIAALDTKHSFEIGGEAAYFSYDYNSGAEMQEGPMYGIVGAYSIKDEYVFRGEARVSSGEVNCESISRGEMEGVHQFAMEGRILIGKEFEPFLNTLVTPYIGLGDRYLVDDMAGKVTDMGVTGFERKVNYIYSPIGIDIAGDRTYLDRGWILGGRLEYDWFLKGSEEGRGYDIELDPGDSDGGFRGSLRIAYKIDKIDFILEPFYRLWQMKKSKSLTDELTGLTKKNKTEEFGISLSVKF